MVSRKAHNLKILVQFQVPQPRKDNFAKQRFFIVEFLLKYDIF